MSLNENTLRVGTNEMELVDFRIMRYYEDEVKYEARNHLFSRGP